MFKRAVRYFLTGLFLAQVGGCASYKQGTFPVNPQYPEEKEETIEIRVGSEVQIELFDGEKISGEVVRVSESELVIGKASNYGYQERTFQRDQMAEVKVRKYAAVATFAVATLGFLAISIAALGALIIATGGINMS